MLDVKSAVEALKTKALYCAIQYGNPAEYSQVYFVWAYDIDDAYEELDKALQRLSNYDRDVKDEFFCFSVEAENYLNNKHGALVNENGAIDMFIEDN